MERWYIKGRTLTNGRNSELRMNWYCTYAEWIQKRVANMKVHWGDLVTEKMNENWIKQNYALWKKHNGSRGRRSPITLVRWSWGNLQKELSTSKDRNT